MSGKFEGILHLSWLQIWKLRCLVLMYLSCIICEIFSSNIIWNFWIISGKSQGNVEILSRPMCGNPDFITVMQAIYINKRYRFAFSSLSVWWDISLGKQMESPVCCLGVLCKSLPMRHQITLGSWMFFVEAFEWLSVKHVVSPLFNFNIILIWLGIADTAKQRFFVLFVFSSAPSFLSP